MHTTRTEMVVDEEAEAEAKAAEPEKTPSGESADTEVDEDEAVVEDVSEEKEPETKREPKMKPITVEEWLQLNSQPPIWMRDPKTVTDEEYESFYQVTFKDYQKPLAWYHFSGDSGSGVSFRSIIYVPSRL